MDFSLFLSYEFLIIAIGTCVLASVSAMVGTVSVLKGQSLIGDAIGHASFPGVILAFMLFLSNDPILLILGAIFSGICAFSMIQLFERNSKLKLDTILAVILTTFFALGMVLKTHIQGNNKYGRSSQAGLQNYIFGQAAYIMKEEVLLIIIVSAVSLFLLVLFFKEIKLFVFDSLYSSTSGFRPTLINAIILIMSMNLIAIGLKVVGAILISCMLIAPGISALQWSTKFGWVLVLSAFFGGVSAVIGTYISIIAKISTGSTIVCVMSVFAIVSMLIGPRGVISQLYKRMSHSSKSNK